MSHVSPTRLIVAVAASLAAWSGVSAASAVRATAPVSCRSQQLRVSEAGVPGGAGHEAFKVVVRNGGRACRLSGYPSVEGLTSHGRIAVRFKQTLRGYLGGARRVQTVVLARGQYASVLIEGLGGRLRGGPPCAAFSRTSFSLPGAVRGVTFAGPRLCAPQVHPIVAGRSGGAF